MKTVTVGINDVAVVRHPVQYVCYGLGSCIGLFLVDRQAKIFGAAHIPMPDGAHEGPFEASDAMLERMLSSFVSLGSDLQYLRAKVVGGSEIYPMAQETGQANAASVMNYLVQNRIYVAASDIGGNIARTARFNSTTERLLISTSARTSYLI